MNIPKKITPDNLRDTIVEIRFDSLIPIDLIPGSVYSILKEIGFNYVPNPESTISFGVGGQNQQISIGLNGSNRSGFFTKDNIRIQFIGNVIAFNCLVNKYIGWDNYSEVIKKTIQLLINHKIIKSFNRISIRYISQYENIDILNNIKGCIELEQTGLNTHDSIIRLTKDVDSSKIFVTLTNRTKNQIPNNILTDISLIDINVFENMSPSLVYTEFEKKLDKVHYLQKETFFKLISDKFLESLNPEY